MKEQDFPRRPWAGERCDYGFPLTCGAPADYECYGYMFPYPMPGCEAHARLLHSSKGWPTRLIRPESPEYEQAVEEHARRTGKA